MAKNQTSGITTSYRRRTRRGNGEGSIIELKGKRTRPFLIRLPADLELPCSARRGPRCFRTRREAQDVLRNLINERHTDPSIPLSLQEIYDRFVSSRRFTDLGHNAQNSHRNAWHHLAPSCAKVMTDQVDKYTFQIPINNLADKGYKRESLAKLRNLASLLCQEAMGIRLMDVNYARLVDLPRSDYGSAQPFSLDELKQLWAAADSGNTVAMSVLIMCYTGLRPNELLTLNIDTHLHQRDSYRYFRTGSKTRAGRNRFIPIPKVLYPVIDALVGGRAEGPLIPNSKGGFYSIDNWRKRQFHPLMHDLNIENRVPYSGRHTYADIQKRRKIPPDIMVAIFGLSRYDVCVERYQTPTEDDIPLFCSAVDGMERPA